MAILIRVSGPAGTFIYSGKLAEDEGAAKAQYYADTSEKPYKRTFSFAFDECTSIELANFARLGEP